MAKEEGAFKDLSQEITLSDIHDALNRAAAIQRTNAQNYKPQFYRNYDFFTHNPSLSIHERIREIFAFRAEKGFSVL